MKNLLEEIIETLNKYYGGHLDCEEQKADLFVYVNGNEEQIKSIDTETLYFENDEHNVKLIDTDIAHLSYINNSI
tara:strand:- start:4006 stop:4230 length:225 start_codon:yes stop_codon:yes gene_type:complete